MPRSRLSSCLIALATAALAAATLLASDSTTGTVTVPGLGTVQLRATADGVSLGGVALLPVGDTTLFALAGLAWVRGEVAGRVALGTVRDGERLAANTDLPSAGPTDRL